MDERLEFRLCRFCLERQQAAQRGIVLVEPHDCFVCGGLSDRVDEASAKVVRGLRRYEFRTFAVGLTLPQGVQEREDTMRSELRIRGGETVKAELGRRLAKAAAKKMRPGRKRIDRLRPDVTAFVDLGTGAVEVTSKPLFLYGRYTKPRGIAQRRLFCEHCNGRGCDKCGDTGYSPSPSVEGLVSKRLGEALGSKRFRFTWFGSEDSESAVFSPGRPMIIESKSPRKRQAPRAIRVRTGKGELLVSGIRVVRKKLEHPRFTFMTRLVMSADRKVSTDDLRRLQRDMRNKTVKFSNSKGRMVDKKVYSVKARARGTRITADVKLDGGLPVKRLVSGDAVSPSFSESMMMPLHCERFDIMGVWPKPGDQG